MGYDGYHPSDLVYDIQKGFGHWIRRVYDDLSHQHAQGGHQMEIWRLNIPYEEITQDVWRMVALLHRSHPRHLAQRRHHLKAMGPNGKLPLPEKVEQEDMQFHQDIHRKCGYMQKWWFVLTIGVIDISFCYVVQEWDIAKLISSRSFYFLQPLEHAEEVSISEATLAVHVEEADQILNGEEALALGIDLSHCEVLILKAFDADGFFYCWLPMSLGFNHTRY